MKESEKIYVEKIIGITEDGKYIYKCVPINEK